MDIDLLTLLIDTGMFILIWIVQLVIYPSFNYYTEENLTQWHSLYTFRISIVVLPLMLSQLLLYGYAIYSGASTLEYLNAFLVALTWLVTFSIAVPLHTKIDTEVDTIIARKKLVSTNWIRTAVWTLILTLSLIQYAK